MVYSVRPVGSLRDISRFIRFPDRLYAGDGNYTPYMAGDLRKNLKKLLLRDRSYTALLAEDEAGAVCARILFTVAPSKQLKTERCGFFSLYECVEDPDAARALFREAERCLREKGADCLCGPYWPFDPDNRRGLLVEGFDTPPVIFTSYNKTWYRGQFEACGLQKQADTLSFSPIRDEAVDRKLSRIAERFASRGELRLDTADFAHVERDIRDICAVMRIASTELNYEEVPDEAQLADIFRRWRSFLREDMVLILRRTSDGAPVGAALCIPDWFEVIRRMRGRMDPAGLIAFLKYRRHITGLRGMLQYVIPEYQKTGAVALFYDRMRELIDRCGIERIELGTILEENTRSSGAILALHAEPVRRYRLYEKRLEA